MANPLSRQSLKKRRTHDRIIAAAGRIARKNGLAAASVSRVMHGAGLTIGGFYAHFRSKRAMDAEVVQATLGDSSVPWSVDRYLTARHRDNVEHGCAFPAMLSEVARADDATRMAMARAIDARARELARARPGRGGHAARQRALATLAICVGGLALARAMRGHRASDEVLAACRKWACPEPGRRARRAPRRRSLRDRGPRRRKAVG
jgi:TetR/AcrR family transcriptional regulator, transcriptional repressor for nem operon